MMGILKWILLIFLTVFPVFEMEGQVKDSLENQRPGFIPSVIIGGNISIISVNVEKLIYIKPFFVLSGGIGVGFTGNFTPFNEEPDRAYFTLPLQLCGNLGKGKSFGEIGIGGTLLAGGGETLFLPYPMVGYRFLPLKSRKFSFRAWFYYPIGKDIPDLLTGGFGASFGLAL